MTLNSFFEFALKSTSVWLFTTLAMPFLNRYSATVRHLVWLAAVVASTALLPAILFGPVWHVVPREATVSNRTMAPAPSFTKPATDPASPSTAIEPRNVVPPAEEAAASLPDTAPRLPLTAGMLILGLWLGGVVFVLFKLAAGMLWSIRVTRRSIPVTDPQWTRILAECSAALGLRRKVMIFTHDGAAVAATVGILHSRILVSSRAQSWAPERIRMVLLHELAHVKRNDCAVQVLTRISLALQWFQPLAYRAANQMTIEQEQACDDLVLTSGTDADSYAEGLIAMAGDFRAGGLPKWVALSMAGSSNFRERVTAILADDRDRRSPGRTLRLCMMLLATGAAIILGAAGYAAYAKNETSPITTTTPEVAEPVAPRSAEASAPAPALGPHTVSLTSSSQVPYTLDQVYAKLDQRNRSFHAIEADVERTVVNVIVPDDKDIKSGKFSYVRAGNSPRVMLEFTRPESEFILIDKDLLQQYNPSLKRVQQKSIAEHRDTVDQMMAIGFGQSSEEMKKQYEVTLVGDEMLDGQKTTVLDLKPRKTSGTIKTIRLWIDQQQWVAVKNQITAPSGDYSITKFSSLKLNSNIPESRFKLNLTKDVVIVKL